RIRLPGGPLPVRALRPSGLAVAFGLAFLVAVRAGEPAPLSLDEVQKALDEPGVHAAFVPAAPLGIDPEAIKAAIPGQDPLTRAKVSLGKQLYFDPRL